MSHGGGTIVLLLAAIRERIGEALKNTLLETERPGGGNRTPRIVNGYLPPKNAVKGPEHPFVIVRPLEGNVSVESRNSVKVQVIVGTFSEEYDGQEFALMVLQRIMVALCERPVLDSRYVLELPLTWALPEEQPYPYWQVVATTDWTIPAPVQLPEGVI